MRHRIALALALVVAAPSAGQMMSGGDENFSEADTHRDLRGKAGSPITIRLQVSPDMRPLRTWSFPKYRNMVLTQTRMDGDYLIVTAILGAPGSAGLTAVYRREGDPQQPPRYYDASAGARTLYFTWTVDGASKQSRSAR